MPLNQLPEFRLDKLALGIFHSANLDNSLSDLMDVLEGFGVDDAPLTGRGVTFSRRGVIAAVPYGLNIAAMIKTNLSYFRWRALWDAFIDAARVDDKRALRKLHERVCKASGGPVVPPSRCNAATVGVSILLAIPTALHGCVKVNNGYRVVTHGYVRFEVNSAYIVDNGRIISLPLGMVRWKYLVWFMPRFNWRSKSLMEYADSCPTRVTLTTYLLALYQIQFKQEHPKRDVDGALLAELQRLKESPPPVLRELAPEDFDQATQPYGPDGQPMTHIYPLNLLAEPRELVYYYNKALDLFGDTEKNPRVEVNVLSLFLRYCVNGEMTQKTFTALIGAPAIFQGKAKIKVIPMTKIRRLLPTFSAY